jgi:hypothetical protein
MAYIPCKTNTIDTNNHTLTEGVRAESSLTLRTSLSTEGYEFGVAEDPHLP